MSDDVDIRISPGQPMPRIVHDPSWIWRCGECGWLGVGCNTTRFALQESGRHFEAEHPEKPNPMIAVEGDE